MRGYLLALIKKMVASNVLTKILVRPLIRIVSRLIPFDSTLSTTTHWINLELTSKCNLRCVYCGKSSNGEEDRRVHDFPADKIPALIEIFKRRGLQLVYVSGIGETTTRDGWHLICQSLLDAGLNLTIITNSARPLTVEEAGVLARFASVQFSIDTSDADLFARIRRGASLDTLVSNLSLISGQAATVGINPPEFRFDMVVTDKTVFGLEETVTFGISHGVTDFYFADLYKLPDVKGEFNVYNVSSLPLSDLPRALLSLERAADIARRAGCKVAIHSGLMESLTITEEPVPSSSVTGAPTPAWGAPASPAGFTRNCLAPWTYAFLYADGQIRPCCAFDQAVGDLNSKGLLDILDDDPMRRLRQQLLSGRLDGTMCLHCSMKPIISIDNFGRCMREHRFIESTKKLLGAVT